MSNIKRRHFLQFAGSVATIGLSQLDIFQASDRYAQVLAQSTPRKLALLVGINDYGFSPLSGCIKDVRLQQELLIHRFGFNPKDILTLTDNQATRSGILAAFEEHLIKLGGFSRTLQAGQFECHWRVAVDREGACRSRRWEFVRNVAVPFQRRSWFGLSL